MRLIESEFSTSGPVNSRVLVHEVFESMTGDWAVVSGQFRPIRLTSFAPSSSGEDKEEPRQCEVQGSLLQVLVHPGDQRPGEGREAEAVPPPRWMPPHLCWLRL